VFCRHAHSSATPFGRGTCGVQPFEAPKSFGERGECGGGIAPAARSKPGTGMGLRLLERARKGPRKTSAARRSRLPSRSTRPRTCSAGTGIEAVAGDIGRGRPPGPLGERVGDEPAADRRSEGAPEAYLRRRGLA
jgi:hypothetical protein